MIDRAISFKVSRGSRKSGFTLIELIVAMSVMAIGIALAIPSLYTMAAGSRRTAEVNDLVLALNYARSEAIKQNSSNGVLVQANSAWAGGWSVCSAAAPPATGCGTSIYAVPAIDARSTLSASGLAQPLSVAFDGNGALLNTTSTAVFTFCDARGAAAATAVEVNLLGHIQSSSKAGYRVDQTTALNCP